jgi:hypothetical protein
VPVYEELRHAGEQRSARYIKTNFEAELDKFTVWPPEADNKVRPSA